MRLRRWPGRRLLCLGFVVAVIEGDFCARLAERHRHRFAKPAAAAGYEGYAARKRKKIFRNHGWMKNLTLPLPLPARNEWGEDGGEGSSE